MRKPVLPENKISRTGLTLMITTAWKFFNTVRSNQCHDRMNRVSVQYISMIAALSCVAF